MITLILLAGGVGSRFGGNIPKQFLTLSGKPIVQYSLDVLSPLVDETVVVCEEKWRSLLPQPALLFADPGPRRQDSVFNGAQVASGSHLLIHDSARPYVQQAEVKKLIEEGKKWGAGALGLPLSFTCKKVDSQGMVEATLPRESLYEIQTPQFVAKGNWLKGYNTGLEVTDDVSFIEHLGYPVKVVPGSPHNKKITFEADL